MDIDEFDNLSEIFDFEEDMMSDGTFTDMIKDNDAEKRELDRDRLNSLTFSSDLEFLTDVTSDFSDSNSKLPDGRCLLEKTQNSIALDGDNEKESRNRFFSEKKKPEVSRKMLTPIVFEDDEDEQGNHGRSLSEESDIPLGFVNLEKVNSDGSIFSHITTKAFNPPNRSVFSRVNFKNENNTNCNVFSRVYLKDKRIAAHCGVMSRVSYKANLSEPLNGNAGVGHASLSCSEFPTEIVNKKFTIKPLMSSQSVSKKSPEEKKTAILHLQELKIGSFTNNFPCAIELNPNEHTVNFINLQANGIQTEGPHRLNIHIKGVENYVRDGYEIEIGLKKKIRKWIIPVRNVINIDEVTLSIDPTDGIINKAESINMVVSDREGPDNLKYWDNMFREIQNLSVEPITITDLPIMKVPIRINYEKKRIPCQFLSNISLKDFLQLMRQKCNDQTICQPFSCAMNGINGILGVYDERDWEACKMMMTENWDEFNVKDKYEITLE
ncbi:9079_t:CDS:2, partial [Acaulospora morrowiae]